MDLTGQLLVAMPGMDDPRFARSVVFICGYSDEGAMGLIINKHVTGMPLGDVFERMEIEAEDSLSAVNVHYGGPVQTERGFVLHQDQTRSTDDQMAITGGYCLTATKDILTDLGAGNGPAPFLFALGYAGWGAGQLEGEIAQNGWLTAAPSCDLVFGSDVQGCWDATLRSIGIDPVTLSGAAGRA